MIDNRNRHINDIIETLERKGDVKLVQVHVDVQPDRDYNNGRSGIVTYSTRYVGVPMKGNGVSREDLKRVVENVSAGFLYTEKGATQLLHYLGLVAWQVGKIKRGFPSVTPQISTSGFDFTHEVYGMCRQKVDSMERPYKPNVKVEMSSVL